MQLVASPPLLLLVLLGRVAVMDMRLLVRGLGRWAVPDLRSGVESSLFSEMICGKGGGGWRRSASC